jgi:hypothetical protein
MPKRLPMNDYLKLFIEYEADKFRFEALNKNNHLDRFSTCFKYSFAVPNQEALNAIAKYSPLIELGAGSGFWAHLLQQQGVDIIPYDNFNWKEFKHHYTTILEGSESTLLTQPTDKNLMLCWPDYDEPFAYNAAKNFRGKYLIYIGEGSGGCTGDEDFHKYLDSDFSVVETIKIPRWAGIRDRLYIYERRANA